MKVLFVFALSFLTKAYSCILTTGQLTVMLTKLGEFIQSSILNLKTGFHMIAKDDPELIKIAEDCGEENSVDITLFEPEKHADMMKLFEKKDFRCFAKCMTEKSGLINDKGEANKDNIMERFELKDDHVVFKLIDECSGKVKKDDMCDQVFEIEKCIMESLHQQ